ncbi:MAG: hypothetical protein KatS3mg102_2152 [Planctomycetota bacterium]|nr:MAG: hypothetical protein KatS3mg102_2152 [Planctomycetota bacterium]
MRAHRSWLGAAVLVALVGAPVGCGSGPEPVQDGPPPPELEPAEEQPAAEPEHPAAEPAEAAEHPAETAEHPAETAEHPAESAAPAAEGQIRLVAKLAEGGEVQVLSGETLVGKIVVGKGATEELKNWLKKAYEANGQATVRLEVPVTVGFDDVGKPLMQAVFAAGFAPNQVQYAPVE